MLLLVQKESGVMSHKDDSSLVQLFIMLHRPVNFEISAVACTSQQANLKKQWSMKYYKQLNGKAIIFNAYKLKTLQPIQQISRKLQTEQ